MARLILTTSASGAGGLLEANLADCVIPVAPKFVWGPLPAQSELETRLSSRSSTPAASGLHWLDFTGDRLEKVRAEGPGLIEFCERFETVEFWVDPDPNDQLTLVWLLDYLRHHTPTSSKLALVQTDVRIGSCEPEELARSNPRAVTVLNDHLEAAGMAWHAWRQSTPQDWSDLLGKDLIVLPQLQPSVLKLLEELPMDGTGLGATEMLMLEVISAGDAAPFDVFPGHHKRLNNRRVFGYWEIGTLLDGLARCQEPAVSGLEEGPFTLEMHDDRDRYERYRRSRLKLTALGEAILAQSEDFSRHNPIHRWWGGTELTNKRLWRWDPANRTLIAPRS
jgi:hypothetical protein